MPTKPLEVEATRVNETYIVSSLNGYRDSKSHSEAKKHLLDYDTIYQGRLNALYPGESALPAEPLVENKLKNATHDLARLAADAKGSPVFMREKEDEKASAAAAVRTAIADTFWQQNKGARIERKVYLDLISAGFAALSVFYNDKSEYPQVMRLNPRFCYPDVFNEKLQSLLYVENMKERQAARLWPDLGLSMDAKNNTEVEVVIYYDDMEVVQAVCTYGKAGKIEHAAIVSRWEHGLGCVPVAFNNLESADDTFHGLFDQLGGPMMVRNKTVRLLADYLESMAHAPFEEKNIMNSDDEPSPVTIYHHDQNSQESFMRRVQPAAPAGAVFGLLQYMDAQESSEAIQPPARVGVVSQSIASGSFVASTQGTLSSAVKELQETCADLRVQADYIAFKIDAMYLDEKKPLWRAVGDQHTYQPSKDMGSWTHHKIDYGAAAGLNAAEADNRVLQHLGARLIDRGTARRQIDYLEDVTVIQERIDREGLQDAYFQRLVTDPSVPMSALAETIIEMGDGTSLIDTLKKVMPALVQAEAQAAAAGGPPTAGGTQAGPAANPEEEQAALEAGATGGPGLKPSALEFAPPPLQTQLVRNIGR